MRSDSWAPSLAEAEVRKALPLTLEDLSTMKGGRRFPPLSRVNAPEAQLSSTAMRRSAGKSPMAVRMALYLSRLPYIVRLIGFLFVQEESHQFKPPLQVKLSVE